MSSEAQENILLGPYTYLLQIPGKAVRSKLAKAFNHWLNIEDDKLEQIVSITQMLHNSSLLIDDIEDNSTLRRGIPVAHNIYGVPQTINAANYVYFLALEKVHKLCHPEATSVFTEQVLELHRGQGMDIYWRDAHICPSEEDYCAMVIRKTGGLFGVAVRLMQLFSTNHSDFKPLLDNLGLFFQIRDDLANLASSEYEKNKTFAEDLTEGKFSFPLIHAILHTDKSEQIMSILRQRTKDLDVKKYCVKILHECGSIDYTQKRLLKLRQKLLGQLEEMGGNPVLTALIDNLSQLFVKD